MPEGQLAHVLAQLPPGVSFALAEDWASFALDGQRTPEGDWRVWLLMAGRGFGKTRAGAEWVSALARADGTLRIALVGATLDEVVRVMIDGDSGLRAVARANEPVRWVPSRRTLRFASGAEAYVYSAERPDALRGPQHHYAWCDELAKWAKADATWDNLMLGLRLGDKPRVVVTTTPKPVPLLRRILAMPRVAERRGRTADNLFLAEEVRTDLATLYGGTRIGRQELEGELLLDLDGALWTRAGIEAARVAAAPALARVVVAVDPPASEAGTCGIVVAGLGVDGRGYVLADASVSGASPESWARAVAAAAAAWGADRVVAEGNQGGAMVSSLLRAAEAGLPVRTVHAARGKVARAEPVAALFESGRARFVGAFPALEDQLAGMLVAGGYAGPGASPDRADAMVWALHALLLAPGRGAPGVRAV